MTLIIADRVKESTVTAGTGRLTLSGATFGGFQTLADAIGDGNDTYYCIQNFDRFEIGIGNYRSSDNTISRDTVYQSSNSDSLVNLSGPSIVFSVVPADRLIYKDENNSVVFPTPFVFKRSDDGDYWQALSTDFTNRVASFFMEEGSDPTWKIGLKTSSSDSVAPFYAYISASDGSVELKGNSSSILSIGDGSSEGLQVNHQLKNIIDIRKDGGEIAIQNLDLNSDQITSAKNTSVAYTVFAVESSVGHVSDLQTWSVATNEKASINQYGDFETIGNIISPSGRFTAIRFSDATIQTTAALPFASGALIDQNTSDIIAVSGLTGGGGGGDVTTAQLNYVSGIAVYSSGILTGGTPTFDDMYVSEYIYHNGDTNTYIRMRGDQFDFVAGAKTMLTLDEASNDKVIVNDGGNDIDFQVEGENDTNLIRTDAANDMVGIGTSSPSYKLDVFGHDAWVRTSGIIVGNSGVVLANNAPAVTTNTLYNDGGTLKFNGSTVGGSTYTAGSGLELHGTAFQAAISGANLLATNTPSDNQLPSYDLATGKFTWVSAGAGEANEYSFKTISVAGQDNVVADTTTDTLTFAAGSNVTITTTAGSDTVTIAATDTVYTLPEATATTKGGIELFSDTDQSVAATAVSTTASRTYGLQLNSDGQGVVNVPWVDTNTTYSVGDGGLTANDFTNADHTKLNGIEASADVTDATNVTAAGALMDSECAGLAALKATTGTFLSADESKLDGIEASATADQTAGEILTLLEDGVDSVHYKDGSIDNAHIADDAIDSEHYAAGSIDTAHIADNQVTLDKMAGITRGSIIIGDSSGDPAALAIGSNTYVLTSDGTDIAWAAAGGGGTVSAVANGADNRVVTFSSADALNGEANLTFDGSTLAVNGAFTATTKSFLIPHPTKANTRLQYGSLEGPENGVYIRGTSSSNIISLPDYWPSLVHEDSMTVSLTPVGKFQMLFVKEKGSDYIEVGGVQGKYDYIVYAERKDVNKLEVEW